MGCQLTRCNRSNPGNNSQQIQTSRARENQLEEQKNNLRNNVQTSQKDINIVLKQLGIIKNSYSLLEKDVEQFRQPLQEQQKEEDNNNTFGSSKESVSMTKLNKLVLKLCKYIKQYYPNLNGNQQNYISINYNLIKLEEIGKGEIGIVYKVYDSKTLKFYALKILRQDKEQIQKKLLGSAFHEIEMALVIMESKNKNFIKLLAFQVNGEYNLENFNCFLLYEYGLCDLENYIQANHLIKWSSEQSLAFIQQILQSLQELHQNKIIHLDIKLSNIVIDESTKSFRFIDYDCSYKLSRNKIDEEQQIPVCGTKGYYSPEMQEAINTKKKYLKCYPYKQDIYSLGIALKQFLDKVQVDKNKKIQILLNLMTEKDPNKRFTTSEILRQMTLMAFQELDFNIDYQSTIQQNLKQLIQQTYLRKRRYLDLYQLIEAYDLYINHDMIIDILLNNIMPHFQDSNQSIYWRLIFQQLNLKISQRKIDNLTKFEDLKNKYQILLQIFKENDNKFKENNFMESIYLDLIFNFCEILLTLGIDQEIIEENLEIIFNLSTRRFYQTNNTFRGRYMYIQARIEQQKNSSLEIIYKCYKQAFEDLQDHKIWLLNLSIDFLEFQQKLNITQKNLLEPKILNYQKDLTKLAIQVIQPEYIIQEQQQYNYSNGYYMTSFQENKYKKKMQDDLSIFYKFKVNQGLVLSVALSSKYLAIGSSDFTAILIIIQSRKIYHQFNAIHSNWVNSVALSSDEKYLATGSLDNTVNLIDIKSKTIYRKFEKIHKNEIRSVVFSADCKYLATGSSDTTINLIDIEKKKIYHKFDNIHHNWVSSVVFSPDNQYLATGSGDETVNVIDVQSKIVLNKFTSIHSKGVSSVSFSPDGKHLVTGSSDSTVNLIDIGSKSICHRFTNIHQNDVNIVTFSPDGKYLATGSDDSTVNLIDIKSKEIEHKFDKIHSWSVRSLAFSPDGKYLATGSEDRTVNLINLEHIL